MSAESQQPFSPHTWGCSGLPAGFVSAGLVLPTHVGMFRGITLTGAQYICSPHTRGDVPIAKEVTSGQKSFSPHTWGCSVSSPMRNGAPVVLPTHVGMFRARWPVYAQRTG